MCALSLGLGDVFVFSLPVLQSGGELHFFTFLNFFRLHVLQLPSKVVVDCSHGNSQKSPRNQVA
jgi:hypothetical protein